MLIRPANITDSADILNWRNDALSCAMSINNHPVDASEHDVWYQGSLNNPLVTSYIGELENNKLNKVGVCRFEQNTQSQTSLISINLNPLMRGKGLAIDLLQQAIKRYRQTHQCTLTAAIKKENLASIKIFKQCGFLLSNENTALYFFTLAKNASVTNKVAGLRQKIPLDFEKITATAEQIKTLYQLLEQRQYNISHQLLPKFDEHTQFVVNHPYRAWYLIRVHNVYIGSVYLLESNAIGISLLKEEETHFTETLRFIFNHYQPLPAVKSIRPDHFYINIAPNNNELIAQLERSGAKKIQVSYALSSNDFLP